MGPDGRVFHTCNVSVILYLLGSRVRPPLGEKAVFGHNKYGVVGIYYEMCIT